MDEIERLFGRPERTGFVKLSLTNGQKVYFQASSFGQAAAQLTLPFGEKISAFQWVSKQIFIVAQESQAVDDESR